MRARVVWSPQWRGPIEGYAVRFLKKNQWRFDPLFEFEDLLNDAYLIFAKIAERYPRVVEPRHFMSLFKTALANDMWDKTKAHSRRANATVNVSSEQFQQLAESIATAGNSAYLSALLAEAPEEVWFALSTLTSRDTIEPKGADVVLNSALSRAYGLKRVKFDFIGSIKELLK
jgi:hypothetical protein